MQIISGLASLLKRGRRGEDAKPAHSASALLAPGLLDLKLLGSANTQKKRRLSAPVTSLPAVPPPAPPEQQPTRNFKTNPLWSGGQLACNPLFSEAEEAADESGYESDEYEPIDNDNGSSYSGSVGGSSDWECEQLPPEIRFGSAPAPELQGLLADLLADSSGGGDSSGEPSSANEGQSAFWSPLLSWPVLSALAGLERADLHPVPPGTLDSTVAALLVLCRRAKLAPEALAPDVLLTLLWVLESVGSQHRETLGVCLRTYLTLLPTESRPPFWALRERMLELQAELLDRCGWRVVLRDNDEELQAVQQELGASPAFRRLCAAITMWAKTDQLPLGLAGGGLEAGASPGGVAVAAGATAHKVGRDSGAAGQMMGCPLDAAPARVLVPHNK